MRLKTSLQNSIAGIGFYYTACVSRIQIFTGTTCLEPNEKVHILWGMLSFENAIGITEKLKRHSPLLP